MRVRSRSTAGLILLVFAAGGASGGGVTLGGKGGAIGAQDLYFCLGLLARRLSPPSRKRKFRVSAEYLP